MGCQKTVGLDEDDQLPETSNHQAHAFAERLKLLDRGFTM
jgi:hypothetical protein